VPAHGAAPRCVDSSLRRPHREIWPCKYVSGRTGREAMIQLGGDPARFLPPRAPRASSTAPVGVGVSYSNEACRLHARTKPDQISSCLSELEFPWDVASVHGQRLSSLRAVAEVELTPHLRLRARSEVDLPPRRRLHAHQKVGSLRAATSVRSRWSSLRASPFP
jgi:hypothetical protein